MGKGRAAILMKQCSEGVQLTVIVLISLNRTEQNRRRDPVKTLSYIDKGNVHNSKIATQTFPEIPLWTLNQPDRKSVV